MTATSAIDSFFSEIEGHLGPDAVNRSTDTTVRYGENTMPGGSRTVDGVVYPASTGDVQAMVRAANKHGVGLYPNSTGNNIGLGSRSPALNGQDLTDPGRRTHPILSITATIGYSVDAPCVTYPAR